MSEVSEAMLQLCGGVWAKGRKDSDGPELEGRLLHVVPQVALHCRLCKGSERSRSVVVGKSNQFQLDHGGRLTTVMRDISEVTTQEDEDGHVRVTVGWHPNAPPSRNPKRSITLRSSRISGACGGRAGAYSGGPNPGPPMLYAVASKD